ncbi:MAG: LicD family protein [Methanobrevibacter sp.]|jgi:lipopolysaccharide cholinephosphotransferase|nr:LicD family protein [Candidatus Methanoflexus mossambicus]
MLKTLLKNKKNNKNNENNEKEIKNIKKKLKKMEKRVDSNLNLLNFIFLNYKIEAKGYLRYMQLTSLEILKFFDYICQKHDIQYWLDYGTLLGAIRHEGFIPWDDDLDVGVIRKDYDKLMEILPKEVERYGNLNGKLLVGTIKKPVDENVLFIQLRHYDKFLSCLDIFPYDYIKKDSIEFYLKNSKEICKKYKKEIVNAPNNLKKDYLKYLNEKIGATDESDYIMVSGEFSRIKMDVYLKEDIFPLKPAIFEGMKIKVPSNYPKYLESKYGNKFMKLPTIAKAHSRSNKQYDFLSEDDKKVYEKDLNYLKSFNESLK